jgi:hypothetical protein
MFLYEKSSPPSLPFILPLLVGIGLSHREKNAQIFITSIIHQG